MALYSALQPTIEANQWFRNGDHPDDHTINRINTGRVVGRAVPTNRELELMLNCTLCDKPISKHGQLNSMKSLSILDVQLRVCPGDYIQTHRNEKGKVIGYTLLKQQLFENFYGPYKEPKE